MLTDLMVELQRRWSSCVPAKLFVDDLTLAACGTPREIVDTLVPAADFVIDHFERELRMEVSAKKSKVVAYGASEEEPEVKACNPDGEFTVRTTHHHSGHRHH